MIKLLRRTECNKILTKIGLKANNPGPLSVDQEYKCWKENCYGFVIGPDIKQQLDYYKELIQHFHLRQVYFSVNVFYTRRYRTHEKSIYSLQKRISYREEYKEMKKIFHTPDIFSMCGFCTGREVTHAIPLLIRNMTDLSLVFTKMPIHIYQCSDSDFHFYVKGKDLAYDCARLAAKLKLEGILSFIPYEAKKLTLSNYSEFIEEFSKE